MVRPQAGLRSSGGRAGQRQRDAHHRHAPTVPLVCRLLEQVRSHRTDDLGVDGGLRQRTSLLHVGAVVIAHEDLEPARQACRAIEGDHAVQRAPHALVEHRDDLGARAGRRQRPARADGLAWAG